MSRGGRYLRPEQMQQIAELIESGKGGEALSIVTAQGRSGKWKAVNADPEEFLSAEANGTLRVVIAGPKKTVCLERPVTDYAKKDRKYIYQDLAEVL